MSQSQEISVNEYPGGILAVDSGLFRPQMACCYIIEHAGEAAIVEAGGHVGAKRLLAVLEQRGIAREDVRYVMVTHVHLDHAGGAGLLMEALPQAQLLVHPKGAKHMIDPSKLEAGTRAVYGDEQYEQTYGSLIPVPAARVHEVADNERLDWRGRTLRFIDSPGHASHHYCVHDAVTKGWFTGDTFGLSYRELDTGNGPFIFPTTTPIDFDPDALRHSIGRLLEAEPEWMYLTHYGRIGHPHALAPRLVEGVDAFEAMGLEFEHDDDRVGRIRQAMTDWLMAAARAHGVTLPNARLRELLDMDIGLNVAGIDVWLNRRARRARQ